MGRGRFLGLDALRGIAAVLVVANHAIESVVPGTLDRFDLGRFGVVLFFLISGFVIPLSFSGSRPIERFAISRATRLLPALWLSIFIAILWKGPVPPPTLAGNMLMIATPLNQENLCGCYWTLSYELGFYFFCAITFAAGMLYDLRLVVLQAIAFLALTLIALPNQTLLFFVYMLIGLLLGKAYRNRDRSAAIWSGVLIAGLLATLVKLGLTPGPFQGAPGTTIAMIAPLPLFLVVLWRNPDPPTWLIWLGRVSYSAYLFQEIGLNALAPLKTPAPLLYVPAVIALTLLIAHFVYRFVEAPGIAFGRTLITRRSKVVAPA